MAIAVLCVVGSASTVWAAAVASPLPQIYDNESACDAAVASLDAGTYPDGAVCNMTDGTEKSYPAVGQTFVEQDYLVGGIVPCGRGSGSPCTLCHLLLGIKNIIDWGMKAMVYFGLAVITGMGVLYIVSVGDNGLITMAKNGIKNTLIGMACILGAWLIVSYILEILANETTGHAESWYSFTCDVSSKTQQPAQIDTNKPVYSAKNLSKSCSAYKADFDAAGTDTVITSCFLQSIASAESNCNPSAQSPKNACGIMQLLPETAEKSCDFLKSNPQESIRIAAKVLKDYQNTISRYSQFTIDKNDLIASYNAGVGNGVKSDGKKEPFAASVDCPGMPAWECPKNPGGFDETQKYVQKVLQYEASCN
jgi:soluble lytic murein transglycosylase-like protein